MAPDKKKKKKKGGAKGAGTASSGEEIASPKVVIKQEAQDRAIDHIKLRNLEALQKMLEPGTPDFEFLNKVDFVCASASA
jgi:hypothetical protein